MEYKNGRIEIGRAVWSCSEDRWGKWKIGKEMYKRKKYVGSFKGTAKISERLVKQELETYRYVGIIGSNTSRYNENKRKS